MQEAQAQGYCGMSVFTMGYYFNLQINRLSFLGAGKSFCFLFVKEDLVMWRHSEAGLGIEHVGKVVCDANAHVCMRILLVECLELSSAGLDCYLLFSTQHMCTCIWR